MRVNLFSMVDTLARSIRNPWIVLGDFNCIANLNQRIGHPARMSEITPLRQCMVACDLHDMKVNGRFFTWNNK